MSLPSSLSALLTRTFSPSRGEALRFALSSWGLALLVTYGLQWAPAWRAVEQHVFDWLTLISAPMKSQLPITIIGIDEASFTQLGLRWPWPRDLHAKLIDRLSQDGAAVIAFDILFAEPTTEKEDGALAKAIAQAGNVVLAADHAFHETSSIRQWLRLDPIPLLTEAGATTGLVTVELDSDTIARRFPQKEDAFWRKTIDTFLKMRPGIIEQPFVPADALMRHLGPSHTFPYVSYYQVIQGSQDIPPEFFADQIVLIGRDIRATAEAIGTQGDTFATPFTAGTKLFTPGVEIHATAIESALMGQAVRAATPRQNLLVLVLVMLAVAPALIYWNPVRSILIATSALLATAGISYWLFMAKNLWIVTANPALGIVLCMVTMTGLSYYSEQRRARRIRSAFSLYVSPDIVNEMIAHPDRLRLGGERREMTILFCDLADFTAMSERLTPDAVANVINLYLNEMTKIIMGQGGTVDKYIGDAIMAFWGAPLEDKQHAQHAVTAAIAMQSRLTELQPEFIAMEAGRVKMRVGIHSGSVIVGNMGANLRFDYTALGDNVNLASRLEGVNKVYGTPILLTSATKELLPDDFPLRRVDRVRVKGKDIPVVIFTPCKDAALRTATEQAWQSYAVRGWADAKTAWGAIHTQWPADTLPDVFLNRIARLETATPPDDWDGSTALDKM